MTAPAARISAVQPHLVFKQNAMPPNITTVNVRYEVDVEGAHLRVFAGFAVGLVAAR